MLNPVIKKAAAITGGTLALGACLGTALVVSSSAKTAASCIPANAAVTNVAAFVGTPSNDPQALDGFVTELRASTTTQPVNEPVVVNMTLLNGDHVESGECLGGPVLIGAKAYDVDSYNNAKGDTRTILAKTLVTQRAKLVNRLINSVKTDVAKAEQPVAGGTGTVSLFRAASKAHAERVIVAGVFGGANDCLSFEPALDPTELTANGMTRAEVRVMQCVALHELPVLDGNVSISSLTNGLTPSQTDAQDAFVKALCKRATKNGCAPSTTTTDTKETNS